MIIENFQKNFRLY